MGSYKGITFAKGYNRSFAEFKEEFEFTHVFKKFLPKQRNSELKKAYKIATNGSFSGNTKKSKEVKSGEDKQ